MSVDVELSELNKLDARFEVVVVSNGTTDLIVREARAEWQR